MRSHPTMFRRALVLGIFAVLLAPAATAAGHEIPATVTVQSFLRVVGDRLRVVLRVPMASLRDLEFPVRDPGYLLIEQAEPMLRAAARVWIVDYLEIYENGRALGPPEITAVRASLPSDRSFDTFERAVEHVLAPALPADTELPPQNALFDLVLDYRIDSDESDFAVRSGLAHLGLRTTTVLRFQLPDTEERAYQFTGDPGRIELDPSWLEAAMWFVELGFFHILDGIDHLLFLLCLVLPFRRFVPLLALVTSFTVAHSITLAASALGYAPSGLWFPPFVESLIAASIVFMALENIAGAKLSRRWLIAFGFGLVHGFGFSFALSESLQFAGGHLATSLLSFNVGVELGQVLVLMISVPVVAWLFRRVVAARMGIVLISALIAHTAWHWMADRWAVLREYPLQWPSLDAMLLLTAMRWTMGLLVLVGVAWMMHTAFGRLDWFAEPPSESRAGG